MKYGICLDTSARSERASSLLVYKNSRNDSLQVDTPTSVVNQSLKV